MKLLNAVPAAELRPSVEYTAAVGPAGDLIALFAKFDDASRWQEQTQSAGEWIEGARLIEVRAVP